MKKLRIVGYIWLLVIMSMGVVGFAGNVCEAKPQQGIEKDLPSEYGGRQDEEEKSEEEETAEISLSKSKLELSVGKEKQLKVFDAMQEVKWESSNADIAVVSQNGKVTGKKYGTVIVRAISEDQQATCKVTVYVSKKRAGQWAEKNGRCYYYGKYGQRVTGSRKIGSKTYYFDSHGRQRTGWLKIGESYYYCRIAKGAKGYLIHNKTVNQIKLAKSGRARITDHNKTRAYILASVNNIVFENTNWTMTRSEALKKLFAGFAEGKSITYKNIGSFRNEGRWPETYTMIYLENGYGDCYTAGCVYAYLAVALGCNEVYVQSSGGHGWCRINGKYYDPNWAFWGTENIYDGFAVPEALSGNGGRPNWRSAAAYSVHLS